jgi:FKBP-type peptidyl-prolyl cis-trans isomerase
VNFQTALLMTALCSVPVAGCAKPPKPAKAPQSSGKVPAGCDAKTASGLGTRMLTEGKGDAPTAKDQVTVSYKGTLATTGAVFDQSDSAEFGVDGVIPGFAEGLQLIKPGGRIRLCIPAALGYGPRATGSIPANSDLVFEVGLISVKRFAPPTPLAAVDRTCTVKTKSGLGYSVLTMGAGTKPDDESVTLVNYAGYLASNGTQFDAADRVPIPVGNVVPGFSEGLKLMQRGGSYRLCIPAALGYGAEATGPIPANSDLIFRVDLVDFKSMAELRARQGGPAPAGAPKP